MCEAAVGKTLKNLRQKQQQRKYQTWKKGQKQKSMAKKMLKLMLW